MSYAKALELLKKGNKLIDVTTKLIRSTQEDIRSIETIQLMIQHKNLCKEINIETRNFTPEDIIGG